MWTINKSSFLLAIIAYCYIPIFIFLFGWVNYFFSVPSSLLLICLVWHFYQEALFDKSESIKIHWSVICLISLLLLILCAICGYGGFVSQASDWIKHNAILQDLYTHAWPVIYNIDGEPALLTYYHALYLFPALLGKIFHSPQLVEISFGIIGYIGIWLMVFSLIIVTKANCWYKQIAVFVGFVMFSGLLFPLQKVCHVLTGDSYCNNWHAFPIGSHLLQYRSIFVMLRWVGPQCFIAWLCLILFVEYKEHIKWYSIIALPALMSGTWAFLGLVVIMIYYLVISLIYKKYNWKEIISVSNLLPALLPGLILVLYLLGNKVIQGNGESNNEFGLTIYHNSEWLFLFLFYIFIYGVYTITIWHHNRKDILFYAIPLSLISIPLFSIGSEIDFIMGVSIPAIVLLFIYVIQFLFATNTSTGRGKYLFAFLKCCVIIFFILGAQYPFAEGKSIIYSKSWHLHNDYAEQTMDLCFRTGEDKRINILWENYVNTNLDKSIYYKYISKHQ